MVAQCQRFKLFHHTLHKYYQRSSLTSRMPKVALITGATGIVGSAIIEHLLQDTTRDEWSKIIAISRREPTIDKSDDRYVFLPLDLELTEEEIKQKVLCSCLEPSKL